jgi:hypothetical protein
MHWKAGKQNKNIIIFIKKIWNRLIIFPHFKMFTFLTVDVYFCFHRFVLFKRHYEKYLRLSQKYEEARNIAYYLEEKYHEIKVSRGTKIFAFCKVIPRSHTPASLSTLYYKKLEFLCTIEQEEDIFVFYRRNFIFERTIKFFLYIILWCACF